MEASREMKIDKTKWESKRLKVSQLRPYPAQETVYAGTTTAAEDQAFALDLRQRGQLEPVHVLPDRNKARLSNGTVLDGWRRVNAAKANGEMYIDVVIRHDLANATVAEVAAEFVRFNFQRRQLSGLGRARCIKFLMEADGRIGWAEREQLKKQIGEQLNMGLRNVNRYLAITRAVTEVQRAFDQGRIGLTDAGKVAYMPQSDQRAIGTRINGGEPAKKVLPEYLRKRDGCSDGVGDAFRYFVKALDRSRSLLHRRAAEITDRRLADEAPTLEAARKLIDELLKQVKINERKRHDEEEAA
jgi:hypothetical protein